MSLTAVKKSGKKAKRPSTAMARKPEASPGPKKSASAAASASASASVVAKAGKPVKSTKSEDGVFGGEQKSFAELGVHEELCRACETLGWTQPTAIQRDAIPHMLGGRDVIGLAETGSGKTGAFMLPMLCGLLAEPSRRLFGLVLAPTRELAFQIHEVAQALGTGIGAKSCCIVGGVDRVAQAIALAKKPHFVIGSPGRVLDHLQNTKGFTLDATKVLVLDEADRMLSMDFEEDINQILQVMPSRGSRQTYLFSATMTSKVAKLQRASLSDPVRCEVSASKYQTVKTLVQEYLFIPSKLKDTYLVYVLNELAGQSAILFVSKCSSAAKVATALRMLGMRATSLHGQMDQTKRLGALHSFKSQANNVLVATDVAARGLDIPSVDLVINYDVPTNGKDYIHRVGRTARAGKSGRAVTLVTQYDIEVYQRIESMLKTKLPAFPTRKELVMVMHEQVSEATRQAVNQLREEDQAKPRNKRRRDQDTAKHTIKDADLGNNDLRRIGGKGKGGKRRR